MEATLKPELTDGYYYAIVRWRGLEYGEWIERKGGEWELEQDEELVRILEKMEEETKCVTF